MPSRQAFECKIEYLVVKSCHICFKWVKIDNSCKGVLSQNDDFSTKNSNIQVPK